MFGQRRDLMPPRVPELGKAMQQHHQRTAPGDDTVKLYAVDLASLMSQFQMILRPSDNLESTF
jgi:hypothetical protein